MTTNLPEQLAIRINTALSGYSDKDWNYSRILLVTKSLQSINGPYALWCELLSTIDKDRRADLKSVEEEVKWGDRHSNELGILELISLRLNKALFESTGDEYWEFNRPVLRVVKKSDLADKALATAYWYDIQEVSGEDFDNR